MPRRAYLFAGGGTGGHLFPAVAVAECLLARQPDARIVFVGSDRPIEREILAATPYEHCVLPGVGLTGSLRHPLRLMMRSWQSYRGARRVIEQVRPQAVIGCGGFASVAPVVAARRQRIPCLLLEQNVIPGRATWGLSRWGAAVCLTYPQTASMLAKSAESVVTGNPVRCSIANLVAPAARKSNRTLLVLGGSLGAHSINEMLHGIVSQSTALLKGWRIVHQTGPQDEERMRAVYDVHHIAANVSKFFSEPTELYREADIVVSRAGGTTLSELACAGIPAVLCPYPRATANHQWHNAEVFRKARAAMLVEEGADHVQNGRKLMDVLEPLLRDHQLRRRMSAAMRSLARPNAAADVVQLLEQLIAASSGATAAVRE